METTLLILCSTIIIPLVFFIFAMFQSHPNNLPKPYPIIGHLFPILENGERFVQWTSAIVTSTPNLTFYLHRPFGHKSIITANAANVEHMLKSHFHNYEKGEVTRSSLGDFFGGGIFNVNGDSWKFQRKVSSHEFNTKSLRKFIEQVLDTEISDRLIPTLRSAMEKRTSIDFQDVIQRFAFDSICRVAFGHDPEYLSPSLPQEEFSVAFERAMMISNVRVGSVVPFYWKMKRALNVGMEKQLKVAVRKVRQVALEIVGEKKRDSPDGGDDLLSRFLASENTDEAFVADVVISFMIAGKHTTSAALTWFFWLISFHPNVESEILREIGELNSSEAMSPYDQVKDMVYTHAALSEAMRLYPPIPTDTKAAVNDDVLPDGTEVKKGMRVTYHQYAMGRVAKVWGEDWADFRPERWLETVEGKWRFVNREPYTYPVFQAGPRICMGKEMAFIQMKRVVAGVMPLFRLVPALEEGAKPVYMLVLTSKMKGGFPVTVEARN